MRIYLFRFPRRFVVFLLLIIFIASWTILKTSDSSIQTISQVKPIYEGSKNKKMITFTCNVAWGNEYIPKLLELFEQKDIKITFFIEGKWAEKYPELLKLIHSKGHEIGNHGYSHAHHAKLSFEQNLDEIQKAEQVISQAIGDKPTLFAPPYGEFSDNTIKAVDTLNYKLIMWTIDTIDWKNPGPEYIINKVLKNAGNGKIVLMHPTADTVTSLPTIIENLHNDGYKITTVGELLSK
ncbi:MAG: polysaccharide deacetylase family protein [Thermoanaerobacterales bacterium]|jgi:probable sporulation protein (polysaccharide deacetylase family)|nr:polysaccharide deacetylase family protein [Thermoanaerobacterales bacterium]